MMASLHVYDFRQSVDVPEEAGWQRPFTPTLTRAVTQLRLHICAECAEQTAYGRQLAQLLSAALVPEPEGAYDLAIIGDSCQSLRERLFGSKAARRASASLAVSALLLRQPRWPLRHILVILRGQPDDETAVTWALRLAEAAGSSLSLLPVIPSQPGYYSQGNQVQPSLDLLLLSDSLTGRCLRRQLGRLRETAVSNQIVTHTGPPAEQIERELHASDPDLIIVAGESGSGFLRLWLGELVWPLLRNADRPVLVAR
jgi:nucleotide-binding universal stress UspA family protein